MIRSDVVCGGEHVGTSLMHICIHSGLLTLVLRSYWKRQLRQPRDCNNSVHCCFICGGLRCSKCDQRGTD